VKEEARNFNLKFRWEDRPEKIESKNTLGGVLSARRLGARRDIVPRRVKRQEETERKRQGSRMQINFRAEVGRHKFRGIEARPKLGKG